jgi:integrase
MRRGTRRWHVKLPPRHRMRPVLHRRSQPGFRLVLLRGVRRGEALGFRWAGADLDAGYLMVQSTVLQIGGEVTEGRPKTRGSERRIWLDATTVTFLRAHRRAQLADRLRASTAWAGNDLIFCRADGSPWPPDYVSRRFRTAAAAAGLPVIKLHEGRHSAASLARDAGVDAKIRQEQLGHSTGAMTRGRRPNGQCPGARSGCSARRVWDSNPR